MKFKNAIDVVNKPTRKTNRNINASSGENQDFKPKRAKKKKIYPDDFTSSADKA